MVLDLILPIIRSKLSLLALSRTGARSSFQFILINVSLILSRCTASPDNLDGEGGLRSRVHTDVLLESAAIDLKELWDDYGIVGDLIVRFSPCFTRYSIEVTIPSYEAIYEQLSEG